MSVNNAKQPKRNMRNTIIHRHPPPLPPRLHRAPLPPRLRAAATTIKRRLPPMTTTIRPTPTTTRVAVVVVVTATNKTIGPDSINIGAMGIGTRIRTRMTIIIIKRRIRTMTIIRTTTRTTTTSTTIITPMTGRTIIPTAPGDGRLRRRIRRRPRIPAAVPATVCSMPTANANTTPFAKITSVLARPFSAAAVPPRRRHHRHRAAAPPPRSRITFFAPKHKLAMPMGTSVRIVDPMDIPLALECMPTHIVVCTWGTQSICPNT